MTKKTEISAIEAARLLQVGLDYIYRQIWTGKLAGRKVAKTWRIPMGAVQERLNRKEQKNG